MQKKKKKKIKIKEKINENRKNMSFNKKAGNNSSKEEKSIIRDSLNKTDSISMRLKNLKKDSCSNLKYDTHNTSKDCISNHISKKNELFNKIFQTKSLKTRNNIFNDSFHNSFLSEGSEYGLNQKSVDLPKESNNKTINKSIRPSLTSSKKDISIIKKENSVNLSKIDYNNFSRISPTTKRKLSVRNKRHRNSISSDISEISDKSKYISNRFFMNNAKFKTLKEKLKESIIIRPEDFELTQEKYKRKITNKKATTKSEKINKNELNIKNNKDSSKNYLAQITKDNENETEKALKTSKINNSETSKKELINFFTNQTIRRTKTQNFDKFRNLYYKPILYDSLDDDEFEDEDDDNYLYIDPHSTFSLIFDGILFIASIIFFVESPLYLAMTHSFCRPRRLSIIRSFNEIIEIIFIMDLFLGFFRAYYNWEEQLVSKHRYIIKKYLGEWFIFDLIAAIPVNLINRYQEPLCNKLELSYSYYNVELDKLHYLFICNKLLKVIKVHTNNQTVKKFFNKINETTKMLYIIFLVMAFLNYSACLYIFIARNSYPNWILKTNLSTQSFQHIYICSIYILIMAITTVGYGDITCYSFNERIYQIFLLIVGILAYSYAVSAVSNFVQKINEKSADFLKKKSILDEIRLSNPNLPEELYERILRHLKYKNIHEKKIKNLIFDCLPVSLKNDLISEMYKPIIKNFIFFKNFQNKDFIVRVILAFKAIIAYKNDILVTEGDMIEDIMFVKKGVLSVELPINITDPQVNIDKYINMPLLNGQKEQKVQSDLNEISNSTINKFNSFIYNTNINTKKRGSLILGWPNFDNTGIQKKYPPKIKEKNEEEEIRYVKILGIRNNEHFGDVLIFLEQRSPLRLRVRSKKCELFFLKKIDAINISNSHPNIWRRINKKSIYNFKQIQKCIIRIVEIYTSVKTIKTKSEETDIYKQLTNESKNESTRNSQPKKVNSFNSNLPPIKEIDSENKRHSLEFRKENTFNNIFKEMNMNVNIEECKTNKIKKRFLSATNNVKVKFEEPNLNKTELYFNSSSSSSNLKSKKSKKSKNESNEEKLIDLYYGNYKYYKGMHKHYSKKKTIISEQPSIEESVTVFNSNKKKISLDDNNFLQKAYNSIIESNLNNSLNQNSSSSKTLKINDSNSLNFFKGDNNELINNDDEDDSNITSDERIVNKEINPGEEITVNYEKLFNKTCNNCYPKKEIGKKLNNNIEYKNSKMHALLNSLIKENEKSLIEEGSNDDDNNKSKDNNDTENIYENKKFGSDNNNIFLNNYIIANKHILSSINSQNSQSNEREETNRKAFNSLNLSIDSEISIEYKSCYENCNLIANEKLINNKNFQEKLKKFLKGEILGLTNCSSSIYKKRNSLLDSNKKESSNSVYQSPINYKEKGILNALTLNNSPISFKTKKSNIKKCESLLEPKQNITKRKGILRTSSFSDNNLLKNKIKNEFDMNIENNSNKHSPKVSKRKKSLLRNRFFSRQDLVYSFNKSESCTKDLKHKKLLSRKTCYFSPSPLSPHFKTKKKKDDLLSQIDLNIEKTNQNLNNPDQFYSNYFNYLLEEKINYSGFFGEKKDEDTELKREKTIKRGDTIRKIV